MSEYIYATLLPCPFCGGEAEAVHEISGFWTVECVECGALVDGISAWNARAERTCKCVSEYAKSPFDGKTIVLHRCSECHELMRPHMLYCPNCGCKVVDA